MAVTKIIEDFTSYELEDQNEGRREFWKEIMETLEDRTFGLLKIGVPMPDGVGGFFTDRLHVDSINLPESWKIDGRKITYKDDQAFMIFVHEACHFLHLSRDEGLFISPINEKGMKMDMKDMRDNTSWRRAAEYEAGYRAIMMDRAYHMFPDSRVNLEGNLANMLIYDIQYQTPEWQEKFHKKMKGKEGDEYKAAIQKYIGKVKKFSDWADKHHKI